MESKKVDRLDTREVMEEEEMARRGPSVVAKEVALCRLPKEREEGGAGRGGRVVLLEEEEEEEEEVGAEV